MSPRTRPRVLQVGLAVLAAATLGATACSSEDGPQDSTPSSLSSTTTEGAEVTEDGSPGTPGPVEPVEPALVDTGVSTEVTDPMDAHALDGSLLVAERTGRVVELTPDGSGGYEVAGTVVDLTASVGGTEVEKGLLGVTTDTSGDHLYLNHTRADDGATVILELPLDGEPGSLAAGEARTLLVIDQPFPNHNGGDLAWGPDDMLWIGTGDGGGANDPEGRAQRLTDLLGKILRLDPSLEGTGEDLAPDDNPYADGTDTNGDPANPLVWARGARNPWRIAFDSEFGDLWIADVGQDKVEEITVLRASQDLNPGADLGWDHTEGDSDFADAGPRDDWPEDDADVIAPLFTYTHDEGCSISGGFVYHGSALPQLRNHYLFSDYCISEIRSVDTDGTDQPLGLTGTGVVSINPDENGEPLVLADDGIKRIAPA